MNAAKAVASAAAGTVVGAAGSASKFAPNVVKAGLNTGMGMAHHGKDAMERKAREFRELLEAWLKQKIQKHLERLVDKLPQILKDIMDDPEMPRVVARGKDRAIDIVWPDFREEIMWEIAVLMDGEKPDLIDDGSKACFCLRFFRYHLYPYDKTFWGHLRDPVWVVFTLVSLIPLQGVCQAIFFLIFFIIDKRDEYQLLQYILQFKGTQFISHGVIRTITGFFMYVNCVTVPGEENEHSCEDVGPGMAGSFELILGGWVLQIIMVWIAFFLLPCSQDKGRTQLKGNLELERSDRAKRKGGLIGYLLIWDMVWFLLCAAVLVYVMSTRPHFDYDEWPVKHAFFAIQIVYGYAAMPFFFFTLPILQVVLTHSAPTAYDRRGIARKFKGPDKKRTDDKARLGSQELVNQQESDNMLAKVKALLLNGKVDLDDDPLEAQACTT